MSQKAVQNSNNNGGAHTDTHAICYILNTSARHDGKLIKSKINEDKIIGYSRVDIQDGGSCSALVQPDGLEFVDSEKNDDVDVDDTHTVTDTDTSSHIHNHESNELSEATSTAAQDFIYNVSLGDSMGTGEEWIVNNVDGLGLGQQGQVFGTPIRSIVNGKLMDMDTTHSDNLHSQIVTQAATVPFLHKLEENTSTRRNNTGTAIYDSTTTQCKAAPSPVSVTGHTIPPRPRSEHSSAPCINNNFQTITARHDSIKMASEGSRVVAISSNSMDINESVTISSQLHPVTVGSREDKNSTNTTFSAFNSSATEPNTQPNSNAENSGNVTVLSSKCNKIVTNTREDNSTRSLVIFPESMEESDLVIKDTISGDESTIQMVDLPSDICGSVGEGYTFTLEESHIISDNTNCKMVAVGKDGGLINPQRKPISIIKQETQKQLVEELSVQERACLEEIERGSCLTEEEKELIAERQREIQAIQDFSSLNEQGKSSATASMESDEITATVVVDGISTQNTQTTNLQLDNSISKISNSTSDQADYSDSNTGISLSKSYTADTVLLRLNEAGELVACTPDADNSSVSTFQLGDVNSDVQYITAEAGEQQVLQIASALSDSSHELSGTAQYVALPNGSLLLLSSQPATEDEVGSVQNNGNVVSIKNSIKRPPIIKQTKDASGAVGRICEEGGAQVLPHVCSFDGCGQSFSKPSRLRIHEMTHRGERPYRCSAAGCEWAFTTAYKLKRHQECHFKKKDFVCSFPGCDRQFTTIYNLKSHLRLHQRPNTVDCTHPNCTEKFATRKQLDIHLKSHDNAQKTYKCPHEGCNMMFFSPYCMGSHVRVHQRQREFVCIFEGCGKVFDKQCRLSQHTRCHSGERPYTCPVEGCNWAFTSSSKLRRHLQTHTGERQWICPIGDCGKRFLRSEHLKGHIITHTGEKPFMCSYEGCGMRFSARSSLYVHAKKHKEPGRGVIFFCPLEGCTSRYKSKSQLRTHIEKHYKKQLPKTSSTDTTASGVVPALKGIMTENLTATSEKDETAIAPLFLMADSTAKLVTAGGDSVVAVSQEQPATVTVNMVDNVGGAGEGCRSLLPYIILPVNLDMSHKVQAQTQSSAELVITSVPADVAVDPSIAESEVVYSTSLLDKAGAGSARTDWKSNQLLSSRAKRRRQYQKDKTLLSWELATVPGQPGEASEWSKVTDTNVNTSSADAESGTFGLSDVMTSQAITFRDPETGAIYVQTQLLQDDPPTLEGYGDEEGCVAMDTSLEAELGSILHDGTQETETADDGLVVDFASTTINLQDLA